MIHSAIFGIGAWYGKDITRIFLTRKVACVGWSNCEAPALHGMMAHIKTGDIMYIKTHPADQGLTTKAIGIVTDDNVTSIKGAGKACLKVKWIWTGNEHMGQIQDKYNVRNNTLYEEYNTEVQRRVVDLLTSARAGFRHFDLILPILKM